MVVGVQVIHEFPLKAMIYILESVGKRQANYDRKASILMASQYLRGIKQTSVFSRILMLQHNLVNWIFFQ